MSLQMTPPRKRAQQKPKLSPSPHEAVRLRKGIIKKPHALARITQSLVRDREKKSMHSRFQVTFEHGTIITVDRARGESEAVQEAIARLRDIADAIDDVAVVTVGAYTATLDAFPDCSVHTPESAQPGIPASVLARLKGDADTLKPVSVSLLAPQPPAVRGEKA